MPLFDNMAVNTNGKKVSICYFFAPNCFSGGGGGKFQTILYTDNFYVRGRKMSQTQREFNELQLRHCRDPREGHSKNTYMQIVVITFFQTFGCSVAKDRAVFKIKHNEEYSTKLIETSLVEKIYDFESFHVLNLIFFKLSASDSNVVFVFLE